MMEIVIPAITSVVVGLLTLFGVLASNSKAQAITDTKLEALTREVRAHNDFAKRIPVMEEQIKTVNKRINDLEASDQHLINQMIDGYAHRA